MEQQDPSSHLELVLQVAEQAEEAEGDHLVLEAADFPKESHSAGSSKTRMASLAQQLLLGETCHT